jgi:phage shock protein E
MKRLIGNIWCIACIGSLILTGCGPTSKEASTEKSTGFAMDLSAADFSRYTDDRTSILLDVRTHEEFQSGHIPGALMIDYYDEDFADQISTLDKAKTIYIYCRSGGRSGGAMKMMQDQGFDRLYNLNGGIKAWTGAGRAVSYPDQ